jgi:hypothetical protein
VACSTDRYTATFVVAPSLGPPDCQDADFTDIQAAINALPPTGGKVFVKAGSGSVRADASLGQDDRTGGQPAFAATAANASFVFKSRAMPTTISSSGAVPDVKLLLWPSSTGTASPILIATVSPSTVTLPSPEMT